MTQQTESTDARRTFTRFASLVAPLALIVVFVSGGLGCANEESDDAHVFESGVSDSKMLSELEEAEIRSGCEALAAYQTSAVSIDEAHRAECAMAVVFGVEGSCETVMDECLASEPAEYEEPEDVMEFCPLASPAAAECGVTVAEFEACMNALTHEFKEYVSRISCELLTSEDALWWDEPEECDTLIESCPDVFFY